MPQAKTTRPVTEFDDIQALAKAGYGSLPDACHLLLQVKDAEDLHARG